MTMTTKTKKTTTTLRTLGAIAALAATGAAQAHTGHGTDSLFAGLAHPLGLDHLLAMVAVGTWSAVALPAGRRAAGPATFLAALLAGAVAGAAGLALPLTETAIAASVLLFGLMLAFARQVPVGAGLALTAAAALMHGLAHGAELPAGGLFAGYAAGFVVTTALLHAAGLGLGRAMAHLQTRVWQALGGAVGLTGLVLLARG
ncbi:HupE/UreJ family protein [Sphaerotilus natans]|uniref:HupE/UreJ family protein n=1 Tax=Sphaerotilus natans TaxID=34103 RepID=UPI00406C2165